MTGRCVGVLVAALVLAGPEAGHAAEPPERVDAITVGESDDIEDTDPRERARALEAAGQHAQAAEIWSAIARDPDTTLADRRQAAYEAQGALRLDYTARRQPASLCAALDLLDGLVEDDASAQDRAQLGEFMGYRATVRSQLTVHARVHGQVPCPEKLEARAPRPADMPEQAPVTPAPGEPPATAEDPDPTRGRGLRIAGGVSLGVGLALAGVMTHALVQVEHAAADMRDLRARLDAEGREFLTMDELRQIETWYAEGSVARTRAIATGIGAGALLVAGAVMVAVGVRRRGQIQNAAIAPMIGPGRAGLLLEGRF